MKDSYWKNMINGTSGAKVAVLTIDCSQGGFEAGISSEWKHVSTRAILTQYYLLKIINHIFSYHIHLISYVDIFFKMEQ